MIRNIKNIEIILPLLSLGFLKSHNALELV